jgi:hypothetical protein
VTWSSTAQARRCTAVQHEERGRRDDGRDRSCRCSQPARIAITAGIQGAQRPAGHDEPDRPHRGPDGPCSHGAGTTCRNRG